MVRQVSNERTDALRAELTQFLASRPDLTTADMAPYSTLAESTWRSFAGGVIPGGREVVSDVRRVLEQARAGDILRPGARNGAVVLSEDGAARPRRVRKASNFYQTQTVRRVADVMAFCAENCAIGVITADFGVGKTEAVAAWRRANAHKVESLVYEFDQFS